MIYKKYGIKICETWFGEDKDEDSDLDILKSVQNPLSDIQYDDVIYREEFTTLNIDLRQEQEDIFSGFRKNTRYEIRKSLKEQFDLQFFWGKQCMIVLNSLIKMHQNQLQTRKGLSQINIDKFQKYIDNDQIVISQMGFNPGEPSIYHCYYCTNSKKYARLLYSISTFRSLKNGEQRKRLASSNRLLHWKDILFFQDLAFENYDLGGIYTGEKDLDQKAITSFKESFGGIKTTYQNVYQAFTLKGKLALTLWNLKRGSLKIV